MIALMVFRRAETGIDEANRTRTIPGRAPLLLKEISGSRNKKEPQHRCAGALEANLT
jgi:hypothetical protein